jgi:GEVED domain/Secretion system C-terminal sorting domain
MNSMKMYSMILKSSIACFAAVMLLGGATTQAQTYCSSGLGGSTYDAAIYGVSIAGTTLNNPTPGNPYLYNLYPTAGSTTCTLIQGYSYNITISQGGSTGASANMYVWIDFNHNGIYEPSEYFEIGTYVPSSSTALISVPSSAHTGLTGMRVRTTDPFYGSLGGGNACSYSATGETEDYMITIDTSALCSGMPTAGAISGPDSVCPAQPFSLFATGGTVAVGITYQWKSRPAGAGAYTAISGATDASYTASTLPAATDFKLFVTCSTHTDSTTAFTVTTNSFTHCYCGDSSTLGGSPFNATLDSVAIAGTTLNNSYYPFTNPHSYSSYPASGSTTAHLQQGGVYTMTLRVPDYYGGANAVVWIDYNHNGVFDSAEFAALPAPTTLYGSIVINVPFTALTGNTGMRVRSLDIFSFPYSLGPDSACAGVLYSSGETEDYIITIDTTLPCSGTPVAAVISGPDSICAADTFFVAAGGYTIASGLSYQWQSSPSGLGSFTDIAGATDLSYMGIGIAAATDFQLKVTCSASGLSAVSNIVTIYRKSFVNCYCDSASLGGWGFANQIDSVSIIGTTLNNGTPGNSNQYSAFPASGTTTAVIQQGGSYSMVTQIGNPNSSVGFWIDYDHSGTFDTSEWTLISDNGMGILSAYFTVPATAITGQTRLRIRSGNPLMITPTDACTFEFAGETEDYYITIDTALPCTGMPVVGTINGPDSICNSDSVLLSLSISSLSSGLSFQWLSSPAGAGTYTAIAGATGTFYTAAVTAATDYKLVVTCSYSGLSDTTPSHRVNLRSFFGCYCSPQNGTTLNSYGVNMMLNAVIPTTSFDATSIVVPVTTGYVQEPATVASNTAILIPGNLYSMSVTIDSMTYYYSYAAAWIDFNQNGIFDASEYIALNTLGACSPCGTYSGAFTVPSTTMYGQTGMRIRASEYSMLISNSSCLNIYNGETADFVVTVGSTCDTVTGLNIAYLGSNMVTISWNAATGATGYEYVLNTSSAIPTGSGNVTSLTSVSVSALTPGTLYYVHVRVNCGGTYSQWITIPVTTANAGVSNLSGNSGVSVMAYPNPVRKDVTVKISGSQGGNPELSVLDMTGRILETQKVNGTVFVFDLSQFPAGVYFIQYKDERNNQTLKIVKQ